MRSFIGHHEVVTALELEELALGFEERPAGLDRDLFHGPLTPESALERAAREDAARDVIADLNSLGESGDEIAAWDALYADTLTHTVPFLRAAQAARPSRTREAA
ncbi:hypothetical protein ABZ769_32010 [Streptomyces olivoreticuli]